MGFYDYFEPKRLQVFGKSEMTFLKAMKLEDRRRVFDNLLAVAQACDIRNNIKARPLLAGIQEKIRIISEPVIEDRPLDADIERMCVAVRYSDFFRIK